MAINKTAQFINNMKQDCWNLKWKSRWSRVKNSRFFLNNYFTIKFISLFATYPYILKHLAAAAAKSLQSCPTLCDPIDGSPPGSPVPGILQARTLEWVAISFSNASYIHLNQFSTDFDPLPSPRPIKRTFDRTWRKILLSWLGLLLFSRQVVS